MGGLWQQYIHITTVLRIILSDKARSKTPSLVMKIITDNTEAASGSTQINMLKFLSSHGKADSCGTLAIRYLQAKTYSIPATKTKI